MVLQNELLTKVTNRVDENDKQNLDADITILEVEQALKNMQPNKTPGLDGLTKEFYVCFWPDLEQFYHEVMKEIFETSSLSNSQKKGIVKISYKKMVGNSYKITALYRFFKLIKK